MLDSKELVKSTAAIVREYVDAATAPLIARILVLEGRKAEPGEPGKDGTSVTLDDVAPLVAEAVERAVAAIPAPKDGEPGKDGATVSADDLEPVINEAVAKAIDALPRAKDGTDGKDGVGVAGAIINREGGLVLTLTNGETKDLGQVVGRDGQDGKAGEKGADGFSLKDFDIERPDERTLRFKFTRGETTETYDIGLEHPIYRGVFKEAETYERGDTVTWAGSLWHCDAQTKDKPGEGAGAWTLAAKRGRDGKDGGK